MLATVYHQQFWILEANRSVDLEKVFFWLASCKKCSKAAIAIAWSITAFHKIKFPELYKLIQFFLSRQKNSATNSSKFSEILKRHLWKKVKKVSFDANLKIPLRESGDERLVWLLNYYFSSNVGSPIILTFIVALWNISNINSNSFMLNI